MHKDCLTRTRKDPQDAKKFHLICDHCNKCYLDKQILAPHMKHVKKMKGLVSQRQSDVDMLSVVEKEISGEVTGVQKKDYTKMTQEEQKEFNLTQEIDRIKAEIKSLDLKIDRLRDEEEKVNSLVMRDEQFYSDKVKLMNEMYL